MNKEFRAVTMRELETWPGVTITEEDGGKHDKVFLHFNGQTRMVVAAKTPSDVRAVPNHLAVVRRELRALGAERAHVVVGQSTPKKPATKVFEQLPEKELPMSREAKLDEIFKGIDSLRYSEMLELAGHLRDIATDVNLRRGDMRSWAMMLQSATDARLRGQIV